MSRVRVGMHAMRTQGPLQRCQAHRSARPPRQHEQVGVRPQGRLAETECRSPARAPRPDLPRSAEGAARPCPRIRLKRTLSDVRSCGHHFVHCLVRCTPYIRIAELLWQQLGEVVKVLATQVVRQLEGKRLDLFELRFVECKVHSPFVPSFRNHIRVITE